ncbi:MAG: zinc-ribbon domain-containing protein [Deltaproteobacteria bacterium]
MKIQCPDCKKVYQVDDSKIPDAGANIKCKCETKFFIKKDTLEAEEKPIIHNELRTEEKCPKCSRNRNSNDLECPYCGIYYRIYEENLKKKKILEEPKTVEEFKAEEEPKIHEESKAEEVLRLKEALKKAEESLNTADGKQKAEEILDKNKKTLKYTALAVTISIGLLFGIYHFFISQKYSAEYVAAWKSLKKIESYLETGVTILVFDETLRDAKYNLNLLNSPNKAKLELVYNIYKNIRDKWYYDDLNWNSKLYYEAIEDSVELLENPLRQMWNDRDKGAMTGINHLSQASEYYKKAKPILLLKAINTLNECNLMK